MAWRPMTRSVIVIFQSLNSHNLCKMRAQSRFSERKSHLKCPNFFEDSIHLTAPTFLCREALQLALCSKQYWSKQGCPKIIRDAEGQWLNSSSSPPTTLTSLWAISMSRSWGGTSQTALCGQALRFFFFSVICGQSNKQKPQEEISKHDHGGRSIV